jgi:hypothetical protein
MTFHYKRDLRELGQLRELIDDLEMMVELVPYDWAKEKVRVVRDYHKLLYKETHPHHLEYKSYRELTNEWEGDNL